MAALKHLFQPIRIGRMEVKNRIMMPAMGVGFGVDDDGWPTDRLTQYLAERARSLPGMMTPGSSYVHPSGMVHPSRKTRPICLWDEKVTKGLERLVKAIHQSDVRFGAQLNHGGLIHLPGPAVCPSVIPEMTEMGWNVRAATKEELHEYVEAFGTAAERCFRAGFDFLEIHAAHGYLINTFLTPHFNRRTDDYGGSFENRIRFLIEIIREVKTRIGTAMPVGVRLNGDDYIPEGAWAMEDLRRLAPILEREGVDYLHISGGSATYGNLHQLIAPMYVDQGFRAGFSERVKKEVSIPVIASGRIKNPVMADSLIREGKADMVAMGRAFLADPEFVEKARTGHVSGIRPCIADCLGCIEYLVNYGESTCTVNPRLGREHSIRERYDERISTAKRVLVAGAGCAGLEAARHAAHRGHKVILCEQGPRIGGQLVLAASIPKRHEIGDIMRWYEWELHQLQVQIRLNTQVNENVLDEINPDVVIVATGSLPQVPPGFIDSLASAENMEVLMVDELIADRKTTGDGVLIIGEDEIGLQVADLLSESCSKVHLAERELQHGPKMAQVDRIYLEQRIAQKNVERYSKVHSMNILADSDIWLIQAGGTQRIPGIDTIVFAGHRRPNRHLDEVSRRKGFETHVIGDAEAVTGEGRGTILAAIAAGYDVGSRV